MFSGDDDENRDTETVTTMLLTKLRATSDMTKGELRVLVSKLN